MTKQPQTSARFADLGVSKNFLAVLEKNKFTHATPIQHQVIPHAIEGKDVVGIAQTGTGKTLAFSIPMIQQLGVHKGQGLVILPTRELALQVDEVLRQIGKPLGLRTSVLIGGAPMGKQLRELRAKPHIVVATPGRLVDHIEQRNYKLDRVKVVVLDEADRMLDVGFMPQIKRVLGGITKDRQTMLFSATMPSEIAAVAAQHMKTPLRIEVAPQGTSSKNVEQEMIVVQRNKKKDLLKKILDETKGKTLVFSRTKFGARNIARAVRTMGHTATEIHGNRSLNQRKKALSDFKTGKCRVLVATDIAARGIDVKEITLVINFDLPDNSEDYVHRIGRTGRAGHSGKAISFAAPDQGFDVKAIEKLIRKTLPLTELSGAKLEFVRKAKSYGGRSGGRGGRGGGGRKFSRSSSRGPRYGGGNRNSGSGRGRKSSGRPPRSGTQSRRHS